MSVKNRHVIIIAVLIATVAVFVFCNSTVKAETAGMVSVRLEQLRGKYPHNYYWNHQITKENVGKTVNGTWDETWCESVTTHSCNHSFDTIGQYGCNAFDHATACWGFANRVFYEVFGIRASSMGKRYDMENISVGDHVRFKYTHSAIVLSRSGNRITVLECNYEYTHCRIQWDRTDSISNVIWYQHADNWDRIAQGNRFDDAGFILPHDTTVIEANAFENDISITVVDAGHCTSVGAGAFRGCTGLTRIRLSKNCSIDDTAFDGCSSLTEICSPAGGTTEDWANKKGIPFVGE